MFSPAEGRGVGVERQVMSVLWTTHMLAGFAAGSLLADGGTIRDVVNAALLAGGAALLPDIDSPDSYIGRRVPFLSWPLNFGLGHRGVLHSFAGAAAVAVLVSLACLFFWPPSVVFGFVLPSVVAGYLSHVFADVLNPPGVPLLWPLKLRFAVPLCRPGGLMERLVLTPGLIIVCIFVVVEVVRGLA